jgi:hypothetical protein
MLAIEPAPDTSSWPSEAELWTQSRAGPHPIKTELFPAVTSGMLLAQASRAILQMQAAQPLVTFAWRWTTNSLSALRSCRPGSAASSSTTLPGQASCYSGKLPTAWYLRSGADRDPRPPPRVAQYPSEGIRLAQLDPEIQAAQAPILPAFCPTDLHRAIRARIDPDNKIRLHATEQGGYDSGECSRTVPDESHSAENRHSAGNRKLDSSISCPPGASSSAARRLDSPLDERESTASATGWDRSQPWCTGAGSCWVRTAPGCGGPGRTRVL